jgi:hypothetical protein
VIGSETTKADFFRTLLEPRYCRRQKTCTTADIRHPANLGRLVSIRSGKAGNWVRATAGGLAWCARHSNNFRWTTRMV